MCSLSLSIKSRLIDIEHKICGSHLDEKLHEESIVVSKIKSDSRLFFRYAKKTATYTHGIGHLLNPVSGLSTYDKNEMYELLINQFNHVYPKHSACNT